MRSLTRVFAMALALATCAYLPSAAAQNYTCSRFPSHSDGSLFAPVKLNNLGETVGFVGPFPNLKAAILRFDGTTKFVLDGEPSKGWAINDNGNAVFARIDGSGQSIGLVYYDATRNRATEIPLPFNPGFPIVIGGIDNSNTIYGTILGDPAIPFRVRNRRATDLSAALGSAYIKGVSRSGAVTGYVAVGGNAHAFRYRPPRRPVDLTALLGPETAFGLGINSSSTVVGYRSLTAPARSKGFAVVGEIVYDPNPIDYSSVVVAINEAGDTVGSSQAFAGGPSSPFVWRPGGIANLLSCPSRQVLPIDINDQGVILDAGEGGLLVPTN
jgi:hypothetical protein